MIAGYVSENARYPRPMPKGRVRQRRRLAALRLERFEDWLAGHREFILAGWVRHWKQVIDVENRWSDVTLTKVGVFDQPSGGKRVA